MDVTNIAYPDDVQELTATLRTNELIRRLKVCAKRFRDMDQDEVNRKFIPLAIHLTKDTFFKHEDQVVQLLTACCVADIFRLFSPNVPYKEHRQLKSIFLFFVKQFKWLEDPKVDNFKRFIYLLENLKHMRTFSLCIKLEDNQFIIGQLFNVIFEMCNESVPKDVMFSVMQLMIPLVNEMCLLSMQLVDTLISKIIEPLKSQNKVSYLLTKGIIRNTSGSLEPYIQFFLSKAIIEPKADPVVFEIYYELHMISPSILRYVLIQLRFKLTSAEDDERFRATDLLGRMFSEQNSSLPARHETLWKIFMDRFQDQSAAVRKCITSFAKPFLLYHPALRAEIIAALKRRAYDLEETVRQQVIRVISDTALNGYSCVHDVDLLRILQKKTFDQQLKVKTEALVGLSRIYQYRFGDVYVKHLPDSIVHAIHWIKNRVLHLYNNEALEERLAVESILFTRLVPYKLGPQMRMKQLVNLCASLDDPAFELFIRVFTCQKNYNMSKRTYELWAFAFFSARCHFRDLLALHEENSIGNEMSIKIDTLSTFLPDTFKTKKYLAEFNELLRTDLRTESLLKAVLKPNCACEEAVDNVLEITKGLGEAVETNAYYVTIKRLLERVAPVTIDEKAAKELVMLVTDALCASGSAKLNGLIDLGLIPLELRNQIHLPHDDVLLGHGIDPERLVGLLHPILVDPKEFHQQPGGGVAPERLVKLIQVMSTCFPESFLRPEVYEQMLRLFDYNDDLTYQLTIQIWCEIGSNIEIEHPGISNKLISRLVNFAINGSKKQMKHAIRCLNVVTENKTKTFKNVYEAIQEDLKLDSPRVCMATVALGHMAFFCAEDYREFFADIIHDRIVQDLLMRDKEIARDTESIWCDYDQLGLETKAKIEGMKAMMRFVLGFEGSRPKTAVSPMGLLSAIVKQDGDLLNKGNISRPDKAWLRLTAGCCFLKLCTVASYSSILPAYQFVVVSNLINDECISVRKTFALKLNKNLVNWKLPLEFMAIFALGENENDEELKTDLKKFFSSNVEQRLKYIKNPNASFNASLKTLFLPEYILPYLVFLLAHNENFKKFEAPESNRIRNALWFLMKPIVKKNEKHSFGLLKKLLETIKLSKDATNPEDDIETEESKLHWVADLGLELIASKSAKFGVHEQPLNPDLSFKFFKPGNESILSVRSSEVKRAYAAPSPASDGQQSKRTRTVDHHENSN